MTTDQTVLVLKQKRANAQGRRPIRSGENQGRRALVLAAANLTKQRRGGGIVQLLQPNDQAEADRLAKDAVLYEATAVKPRDGTGRRGSPLREELRQPFADDAFVVRLAELFLATLSPKADPSRLALTQFVRWIRSQLGDKNSAAYAHVAISAPALLDRERGTRWWLDQLSCRRKTAALRTPP
jgi:hypothetical protein